MPSDTATPVLTVDLSAIVANWRFLHARRPSGAVLKADAYGPGAARVGAALFEAGCGHFFVATPDEASAFRDVMPGAMLGVLGGLFRGMERDYAALDLVPCLGSIGEIEAWSGLARDLGRTLPAILHFDTGMSRLGLDARELALLSDDHSLLRGIDIRYVMSHLVSAEVAGDALNARQRDRFNLGRTGLPPAPTSLANSAGIFLDETFAFDLARPGAALYGVNPTPDQPNPMRQVAGLTAPILAIRDIPAGATVGYNATWTAPRPSRIATVGMGYADGWHRSHSNRSVAFFDGRPVPLVGRVSMDLTTFDVTDHAGVTPASRLELLGINRSVDDAARDAGTIGYEVLTALGRRYRRVYLSA